MDSINQNQEEQNHKNLSEELALEKIKELADIAKTCFLSTQSTSVKSSGTRPMSVQKVDESGILWFIIANDSHTYKDISLNPNVKLYFQGSAHSDFLYIEGTASLSADKSKIAELWNPLLKTWFTNGEDDSRIALIAVSPVNGYYWDNKNGNLVASLKIAVGAIIGKTLDDSIEGKLNV